MLRRFLACVFTLCAMSGAADASKRHMPVALMGGAKVAPTLPGDIAAAAGTPLTAAHSVIRRMFAGYTAPLFELERASDSTFLYVYAKSHSVSDLADTSGIAAFCSGTTCSYANICDQVHSTGSTCSVTNSLPQATFANQPIYSTLTLSKGAIVSKVKVPGVGHYLRNRTNTSGIPVGNNSTTEYMVTSAADLISSICCGTYGNMEATVADTGNGHMFALAWGTGALGSFGTAPGPWPGVDWENGVYYYGPTPAMIHPISILAKYNSGATTWALKSGDGTTGPLTTLYNSTPPGGYTAAFEGGLSLGEGGDGTNAATVFLEGGIAATVTSDATDAALQASIVTALGGPPVTGPCVFNSGIDVNFATATYCGDTLANTLNPLSRTTTGGSATDLLPTAASGAAYNTFANNTFRITPGVGLLIETTRINYLWNALTPATQTTGSNLANGAHTLWVNGSGSAALSNGTGTGCAGTATNGTPATFTTSGAAGTCTITVTGSLNAFQLEDGSVGSSLCASSGNANCVRGAETPKINPAGVLYSYLHNLPFTLLVKTTNVQNSLQGGIVSSQAGYALYPQSGGDCAYVASGTAHVTPGSGSFLSGSVTIGLSASTFENRFNCNGGANTSATLSTAFTGTDIYVGWYSALGYLNGYVARIAAFNSEQPIGQTTVWATPGSGF